MWVNKDCPLLFSRVLSDIPNHAYNALFLTRIFLNHFISHLSSSELVSFFEGWFRIRMWMHRAPADSEISNGTLLCCIRFGPFSRRPTGSTGNCFVQRIQAWGRSNTGGRSSVLCGAIDSGSTRRHPQLGRWVRHLSVIIYCLKARSHFKWLTTIHVSIGHLLLRMSFTKRH